MRIIEAIVSDANRNRDMDRAEALVDLTFEPFPGAPVERRMMQASAPLSDPKGRDLRTCLIADAVRTARTTARAAPDPGVFAA